MKKKIAFAVYRKWAFEIFKEIVNFRPLKDYCEIVALITTPEREFSASDAKKYAKVYLVNGNDDEKIYKILKKAEADAVFFYGWSWIVKRVDNLLSIALHPSPLPKYRGGSPIQHQILNGEKWSAITVFKMSRGIDDGEIYAQLPMSLNGDINDIFGRMIRLGAKITKKFLLDFSRGKIKFIPQRNLENYPPLKRRKPEEGEIKLESLSKINFSDIYNLVRGLSDPYPNAYILFSGHKILIQKVNKHKNSSKNALILNNTAAVSGTSELYSRPIFLKLKNGYAEISKFKIE